MPNPAIVFFDLGDVVCRFVPDQRMEEFAQRTGRTEQALDELIWKSGLSAACDKGTYTLDQMCRVICEAIDVELDQASLIDIWRRAFEVNEDVYAIAQQTKSKVPAGLLTNNAPVLQAGFPVWFAELERLFDPILFSYEFNATKPDPEIFKRVQELQDISPDQLLLIDDSSRNVEAAKNSGWQAIQYVSSTQLAEELKALGL